MTPEINFYNPRSLILFVCLLQGVIFGVLLAIRAIRQKTRSDYWLAGLILAMCSGLITHFIGFANVYDNNQWLTFFPFELVFAHAPLLYLYVVFLTDSDRRVRSTDLVLFLPAVVYWVFYFVLYLQSPEYKEWWGQSSVQLISDASFDVLLLCWNATLLILAIRHYRRYLTWLDDNYSDSERIKFSWLRNFLYIFAAVFVLETIFDVASLFYSFTYIQAFYSRLLLAFVTYYLAVAGYLRSRDIDIDFRNRTPAEQPESVVDVENRYKTRLVDAMENDQAFLDPSITLKTLSRNLGINSSVLSQTINQGFGKNFNEFINEYRIDEVKKRLNSSDHKTGTILDIALESGFNSKATFNRSFKKFTGVSPREYVETQIDAQNSK